MDKRNITTPEQPIELTSKVVGHCPSCGTMAVFTFIGIQYWPQNVADSNGESQSTLWQCGNCATTISNIEPRVNSA